MVPKQQFTLSDGSPLTRQESFVLQQVTVGEVADLKQEFGEAEEARRLRARFLEELLIEKLRGFKVHRHGILISNGIIEESLTLENAEIACNVVLEKCMFKEALCLRDTIFKKHLDLSNSHFSAVADFHRIRVGINLFCQESIFESSVNLAFITIGEQFAMVKSKFIDDKQVITFNGIQVGHSIRLDDSEFHGPVNLGGANIGMQFVARRAKFLSKEHEVNFNAIKVGQSAFLNGAEFHGPLDFVGAEIKEKLDANGVNFFSRKHKADFHGMRIGQDAFFQGCDFHGLVSFVSTKIAGDLHLEPLLKTGQEMATAFHSGVNFHGADIGGEFLADKAQFLGHISNFEAVKVGRSFHASGALFAGSVYFGEMQVRNNFYINPFERIKLFKTLFKGAANFSRLEVTGVFNADQAIFKSENTIFSGLKVGQTAFFNGTIFFGGLVLKEGQLTDLVVRGLHRLSKGGLPLTEIVLNRTRIAHRLTIEDLEVKRFHARNLEVKGPAELSGLVIKDEADLRDAACHHLQLVEIDWPEPRDAQKKVYLDGLTYESITTETDPDKKEDWDKIFDWLSLSQFNTRNYGQLEDYLQRGGNKPRADEIFIKGKRRSWRRRHRWHPGKWGLLLFWDWLAGYGRKPGRIVWVSLAIILIGAFAFEPQFQESSNWLAQCYAPYPWLGRLFLSVDRFLPRLDLGMVQLCRSGPQSCFAAVWWQVQQICGWILIPIGLAAVYTRLK